ncbi:MAG: DNA pilot protein [Microvirus sp.]|nr:MAG: DNA pilot protein [Microvirus sp.]
MEPLTMLGIGSIMSGIGSLAGTALGVGGQREANASNAESAQRMMEFQNYQTSTQYQRGVADLRAAGLNPILAAGGASAGSGGGASYTSQNPMSGIASGVGSAVQSAMAGAEFNKIKADAELSRSGAVKNLSDAGLNPDRALNLVADRQLTVGQTAHTAQQTREAKLRGDVLLPQALKGRLIQAGANAAVKYVKTK